MKKILLFFLTLLPLFVLSQEDIPEPAREKTAFNRAEFGKLSYKILNKLFEEDFKSLSKDINKFEIEGVDLYYEYSEPYKSTREIDNLFKYKYLIPKEKQLKELDSILNNSNWKTIILKNNLLSEILEPISRGNKISFKNNIIYLSSSSESWKKNVYKFVFDEKNNIIFKGYGYTTASKDTLLWKQTNFQYKDNKIFKETIGIFRELNRKLELKESETILYQNDKILKKINEFFNQESEKYREITKDYYYKKSKLTFSKSITKSFQEKLEFGETLSIEEIKYKKNKPTEIKESGKKINTLRKNKYDKKNRLIWSEYEAKDQSEKIIDKSVQEIDYFVNKYVYRYKESIRTLRGKQRLPLQYELTISFLIE